MRFYQVHYYDVSEGSHGSEFFATKQVAQRAAREWLKQMEDETPRVDVDEINIEPTRAGILRALNLYAKHPDNG